MPIAGFISRMIISSEINGRIRNSEWKCCDDSNSNSVKSVAGGGVHEICNWYFPALAGAMILAWMNEDDDDKTNEADIDGDHKNAGDDNNHSNKDDDDTNRDDGDNENQYDEDNDKNR